MTKAEIVASLKEQAIDKDYQADGDEDSIFADDAQALRAAAELLEKSEEVRHGQEPNRVLTLEEIIDKVSDAVGGVPVWIEHIDDTEQKLAWRLSGWKVVRGAERCVLIFATGHDVDTKNINKTWRCWLRKPTAAERAAAPWGGGDDGNT